MKYKNGDFVLMGPAEIIDARIAASGAEEYALAGHLGWHRADTLTPFAGYAEEERMVIWRGKDDDVRCTFYDSHGGRRTARSDMSDFFSAACQCIIGLIDRREMLRDGVFGRDTAGTAFMVFDRRLIYQTGGYDFIASLTPQDLCFESGRGIREVYDSTVTDFYAVEHLDKGHIIWRRRDT